MAHETRAPRSARAFRVGVLSGGLAGLPQCHCRRRSAACSSRRQRRGVLRRLSLSRCVAMGGWSQAGGVPRSPFSLISRLTLSLGPRWLLSAPTTFSLSLCAGLLGARRGRRDARCPKRRASRLSMRRCAVALEHARGRFGSTTRVHSATSPPSRTHWTGAAEHTCFALSPPLHAY